MTADNARGASEVEEPLIGGFRSLLCLDLKSVRQSIFRRTMHNHAAQPENV